MKQDSNHPQTSAPSCTGQEVQEEGQPSLRKVVTICPSVEELRLKSTCPSPSLPLKCPIPGCRAFAFKKQAYLIQHINAVHPDLNSSRGGSGKVHEKSEDYHFHCPDTDCVYSSQRQQRWFSTLSQLRYHYVNTHDQKRFACTKCGKQFGWQRDQEHHERECGQTFACHTCTAKYSSRRSLLTHCLRKQHPVPAQFDKPARKVKVSCSMASSAQGVKPSSAVSQSGIPVAVISSTPSGGSGTSSVALTASAGVSCVSSAVSSSASSGVPCVSYAFMSSGAPGVARGVVSSAHSDVSVSSNTPPNVFQPSVIVIGAPRNAPDGILPSVSAPGVTLSSPGTSLSITGESSSLVSASGMSLPSSSTSEEAVSTPTVSLRKQQTVSPQLALRKGDVAPSSPHTCQLPGSASYVSPVSLCTSEPSVSAVCHSAPGVTTSKSVVSSLVCVGPSASQSIGLDSTTAQTYSGRDDGVPDVSVTQKHSIQLADKTSTTQAGSVKHSSGVSSSTAPSTSMTQSAWTRKKLRPILPKSQGVVVLGMDPSTLYTTQDRGTKTGHFVRGSTLPWMGRDNAETTGAEGTPAKRQGRVGAVCEMRTGEGGGEGERGKVQVHMGIQVNEGALHPLPTCHTATQVYAPTLLRVDSAHTAVQTCMRTAHSATQLSAPLPGQDVSSQIGRTMTHLSKEEECREVCAVAIQTGGQVDMVNMAIQATAQYPTLAHDGSLVVDVMRLCDRQPEESPYVGMVGSNNSLSGTHMACQTSFPYILLNKANSTNTTGTQVVTGCIQGEESDMASKGMQTSVTLIHRPKLGMMAAGTQTSGDVILSRAGTSGHSPVTSRSPRSQSRGASGVRVRKRSTKSSEVQTCSPCTKKGRRRGTEMASSLEEGCVQEISIATQTLTQTPLDQTHTVSDTISCRSSKANKSQRKDKHSKTSVSKRSKTKEQLSSNTPRSPRITQNPPLSVSATQEDQPEVWDPFLSSPITAPSSPSPCNLPNPLEDLFSQELGVQTPQDFLSTFTADFGMQTMDDVLSTTADLGVQTLNEEQDRCTADFGVQTVTTVLGCLLENLDTDLACSSLEEVVVDPTAASSFQSLPETDAASQMLILGAKTETSQSSTTTLPHSFSTQSEDFDLQLDTSSLPSPHASTAPKLFDSFDSDLSFSDCGTGTEDFFTSTHTQTAGVEMAQEDHPFPPCFSSQLMDSASHPHPAGVQGKEKAGSSTGTSQIDMFVAGSDSPPNEASSLSGEADMTMVDFCQSPGTCLPSRPTSSSTTDTDLLSGVPAMDMHTQTADDLLTFLMNNMETQTTEELCDNRMAVTDTHTQTTTSVLLTPPHPLSSPSLDGSGSAWLRGEEEGVVSAETQTSGQFLWDLQHDQEELFDLTDMETQTMLW